MNSEFIEASYIKIHQPIGTFYVCAIEARDLVEISFADVRRPEGRDIERYIGTQRDLLESRVAEIRKYITHIDACFPTSVILSISSDDVERTDTKLRIRRGTDVAKIIDGQHRIAGLENYKSKGFELNTTIFIDMDIEDQAMVFATINLKQTKVGKSLAYDLYDYAQSRSPQKTAHNIAKLLNSKSGSPFELRIKILGKADGQGMQLITQAAFVDKVMALISKDPMTEKDLLKRGKKLPINTPGSSSSLIFRKQFIEEKDAEIAKTIWNFFAAVEQRWPDAWNTEERGMILARTTGFSALMKYMAYAMQEHDWVDLIPSQEKFLTILKGINIKAGDFTSDNFKPGSSGEADLLRALKSQ